MKHATIFMGIVTALAMFTATLAEAQPAWRGDGRGGCPPHMRERKAGPMLFGNPAAMKQELGLTDAQITRIEEINLAHRKQMLEFKEKIDPKETRLKRLLLEDNPNLATVRSALREISDLKIEVHMLKISHRLEIEKVLTAEQKTKLRSMRPHHRRGHPGPGHRPGGPDRKSVV